jgi:oxygen-independent coproporphyrinogen-3 oxidase
MHVQFKAEHLYIHIPFCIKKCNYCDFYSIPHNRELEKYYVRAVLRELEMQCQLVSKVKTIFLGGGTPSILSQELLGDLMQRIRDLFDF